MFGLYINFNSPFGKHFIGTSNTIEGICDLFKEQTGKDTNAEEIKAALALATPTYYGYDDGTWFIVMENTHKEVQKIIRRIPI